MRRTTACPSPRGCCARRLLLSERYITDRFLPDKAIDLIDEACSDLNLHDPDINRRMEVKRDLENVTLRAGDPDVRPAAGGAGAVREGAGRRYDRIAELRSQELRLQQELASPGGQGYARS